MKILHISGAKRWGGNEQQLLTIIPELSRQKIENTVLGIEHSPLHNACSEANIHFVKAKKQKLNTFFNYRFLKKVIRETEADILHLHTSDSLTTYVISDLLFRLKIRVVFSKKGMGSSSSFLSKFKYNYKNIHAIFCVSENVKEAFSGLLNKKSCEKITIIPDCVPLEILLEKPAIALREDYRITQKIIVGNIGNHTRAKDLDTLIDTIHHLVYNLGEKNIVFVQVGEFTKLTEALKSKAREKRIESYLIFTGKIKKGYTCNAQWDIFLTTSEREGGPTSVLEAMLFGVPVISTKVGIVPEIITHAKNGYIADVKDYKSLAKNLQRMINDKNFQQTCSEINKKKVAENFLPEHIARKTISQYRLITSST